MGINRKLATVVAVIWIFLLYFCAELIVQDLYHISLWDRILEVVSGG